ncbi:MAG: SBBP repeat-containing protein [Bacteroidia bacterium]
MKTKIYILVLSFSIILFCRITTFGQAPDWQWAKSAGGISFDVSNSIALDANGNSYITGFFYGDTISFGNSTLTSTSYPLYSAIFIAKYDAWGNMVWAKSVSGTIGCKSNAIAVDANGNSYITGYFNEDSITFGNVTLVNTFGSSEMFVVKYDASGNVIWAKKALGTTQEEGVSLTVDANGDLYVTGYFQSSTITFDTIVLSNLGIESVFVVKYDSLGNVIWAKSAGNADAVGNGIAIDANKNVYVTGFFKDSISFDSATILNGSSLITSDIFIVKYDSLGNVIWAKSAGGASDDYVSSIKVDINGNSYLTGEFASPSIIFGATTLVNAGVCNIFIVKYDPGGNIIWAKSAGGTSGDYGKDIALDTNGNLFVTGNFGSSMITFGSTVLTSNGDFDFFVAKYDSSGNILWAKSAGGILNELGYGIAVDAFGNSYVTGSFESPNVTFGSSDIITAGGTDFFIAKLNSTTGISELNNSSSTISIFPNPTTSRISITNSKPIDEITITNPLGQIIYRAKPDDKNVSVQLNVADGIYFVTLTSGNQNITKKVIVQR